jgi:hypothetical protein
VSLKQKDWLGGEEEGEEWRANVFWLMERELEMKMGGGRHGTRKNGNGGMGRTGQRK